MTRSIASTATLCALLLTLCSCSVLDKEPYRKVCYYDMPETAQDAALKCPGLAKILVSSNIQYSAKMLFKTGPNRYEHDEYNRWLAAPDTLLKRQLEQALLQGAPAQDGFLLKVELRSFEMDTQTLSTSCSLAYRLEGAKEPLAGTLQSSAKAKDCNAGAFAEAMREAFASAAASLSAEIKRAGQGK